MRRTFRRRLWGLLFVGFVIPLAGCGGSDASESPTSPSPTGTRDGGSALTLTGVSVSVSSVFSQQEARGSVSLTGAAPSAGVVIRLSSSNPAAARVPSTVTVAPGASEATFVVGSSTVEITTAVTISASYNSVTRSASLTVRPPAISAAFSVFSPTRGGGACVMGPSVGEADCLLDGSLSTGPIDRWMWRYWTGSAPLGHSTPQSRSKLDLASKCGFFEGGRGGDGPNGDQYVQMEVELTVEDSEGNRSAAVRLPVKMYPNRLCGFNY